MTWPVHTFRAYKHQIAVKLVQFVNVVGGQFAEDGCRGHMKCHGADLNVQSNRALSGPSAKAPTYDVLNHRKIRGHRCPRKRRGEGPAESTMVRPIQEDDAVSNRPRRWSELEPPLMVRQMVQMIDQECPMRVRAGRTQDASPVCSRLCAIMKNSNESSVGQ